MVIGLPFRPSFNFSNSSFGSHNQFATDSGSSSNAQGKNQLNNSAEKQRWGIQFTYEVSSLFAATRRRIDYKDETNLYCKKFKVYHHFKQSAQNTSMGKAYYIRTSISSPDLQGKGHLHNSPEVSNVHPCNV